MSQQHGTSLSVDTPKKMTGGAIPMALGALVLSAIHNIEPSPIDNIEPSTIDNIEPSPIDNIEPSAPGGTEPPAPQKADDSRPLTTLHEDDLKLKDDGGIPQKPANQTTHVMTFTYKGSGKPKRKPRKLEPTPPGLYELTGGKKKTGPLKQFETCPVKANAKAADTTEGIASGRYYSMVHQFPDIIASYEQGPTNLNRETWKMSNVTSLFVPLTPRGHERIAEHQRAMEEKARIEAYESRRWVRFRKGLKTTMERLAPQKKFKAGQEYLKDRGPPVFPEDKARARQKAAEEAAEALALREAEEAQNNSDMVSETDEPEVNELASSLHSVEELSQPFPTPAAQQKAKGRGSSVSGSDEDEEEYQFCQGKQMNSLASHFGGLNTDDSTKAGYTEQANGREKTFNVPARRQNAFLTRGN
ncbi:hypothetical protein BGX38DRAFT_346273 [Terfezia claveryi]|nr:hypothetical protein BGX38DRAFT_346273 [Terfezia claveryi]